MVGAASAMKRAGSQPERTGERRVGRRTNYGFEKRQRELKKQKKKEAKEEKKRLRKEEEARLQAIEAGELVIDDEAEDGEPVEDDDEEEEGTN